MKMLLALSVIALTSCTNTMKVLDGADYICINGELSGIYTGSGAVGRGLKIPEGVELTPELLEALCTR
jgi:hypothetical protein